jgi:hypothetical protein
MLTEEEIKSLMEKVKAIKDYYLSHSPKWESLYFFKSNRVMLHPLYDNSGWEH